MEQVGAAGNPAAPVSDRNVKRKEEIMYRDHTKVIQIGDRKLAAATPF